MSSSPTIEFGYTLTDCYHANANYKGQQKQYVFRTNEGIITILHICGYTNGPADIGRERIFHKLEDIRYDRYLMIRDMCLFTKDKLIDYTNTYPNFIYSLNKKQRHIINHVFTEYQNTIINICEPINKKSIYLLKRSIWKSLPHKNITFKEFDKYTY